MVAEGKSQKKILIVEDEIALQETVRLRLEMEGYTIVTADNGKEGVLRALADKPDLILVDLMLPEMDGYEMIRILHSTMDLKHIPMIAVSCLGRDSDIEKAKAAGAEDYVIKPYSMKDLLKKIQHFLA